MYSPIKDAVSHFFSTRATQTRRVFHGRGQFFEGLGHINLDWYDPVLLVTAHADISELDELLAIIHYADTHKQIKSIMLQQRHLKGIPSEILWGEELASCLANEGDLVFEVHPGSQQNAGLFLDMRPMREWLQINSTEKNVLNLFAYTCSLSVAALAGGATGVTNVDMSKTSIKWGEQNHRLNQQDLRRVKSVPYNVFKSWGRIKQFGRYDIVIIDPPSRQRGSFDVEKNYGAVLKQLASLTHPGADIIATLNSPYLELEFLLGKFQHYAPQCRFIGEMPASPEFADKYPERGLKICHYRME